MMTNKKVDDNCPPNGCDICQNDWPCARLMAKLDKKDIQMTKWKLRKVTENFIAENRVPKLRLECGHVVTDPMLHYGNEKAYAIGVLGATLANSRKVRCYQCGS